MPINIPKIFRNDESIYIQRLSREYGESYDAIHKLWDNAYGDVRMDILLNPSKHSLLGKTSIYELVGERLEKILEERKHEREGTIPDQPEREATDEQAPPETPVDQSAPPPPMPEGTGMDMASASAMPPSDMGAAPPPTDVVPPPDMGAEPAMTEPPPATAGELPTVEDIMADEAF